MQDSETYLRAFWDFKGEIKNGTNDTWAMPQGGGYPVLAWQLDDSPVSNNEMDGAIAVTVGLVISGSSAGASGLDITRNGYKDNVDVWHSFMTPSDGYYTISLCGSNFDTTLAIFDEQEKEAAYNEDYCGEQSKVVLKAKAGKKYYIRIAGYDGGSGDYILSIIQDGPEPLQADINYDGKVNMKDFAVMASEWLEGN